MTASTAQTVRRPLLWAAWYGLAVMILVSMAGNSIGQIIALLAESIKVDLTLSDSQIGAMRGIAITLVTAIASYPVAWVADRVDRRLVFALCMLIWGSATIGMGFAPTYAVLFAFAIGVAFGEAVLGPVTFAIIPDLFPREQRMLANSIFFVSQLLGVSAGLALGGWLIHSTATLAPHLPPAVGALDPWRIAVVCAAIPTFLLIPFVLLMRLGARHPRPAAGTDEAAGDAILPYMRAHARTLFPIFIGFGLLGTANFVPFGWLTIVIIRKFGEDPADVGVALAQVFAVSAVVGVVGANLLARVLAKRDADLAPIRVAQIGAGVAILACVGYLFAESPLHYYLIGAAQLTGSTGALVLSPTLTQNVTPARTRARVIAIGGMFYILFGAISPILVGLISDALGGDSTSLLRAMLMVAIPAFFLGAATLQLATLTLRDTLAAARDEV